MPLSAEHKERTRARILAAAGRVFRRQGYAATAVDAVMAEAGLTRGGASRSPTLAMIHLALVGDLDEEASAEDPEAHTIAVP